MAGIPHHAADGYIARLIRAGQKVAVCEQMEEPAKGRKIVRRDVVRVVTPGTITDTQFLDGARNNFLLAAHGDRRPRSAPRSWTCPPATSGWASSRARARRSSRRRCCAAPPSCCSRRARDAAGSRGAAPAGVPVTPGSRVPSGPARRARRSSRAVPGRRRSTPSAWGGSPPGLQAAGAALAYLARDPGRVAGAPHANPAPGARRRDAARPDRRRHARALRDRSRSGRPAARSPPRSTRTTTPMGARLLRQWLLRPLLDREAIRRRQDAIGALVDASGRPRRPRSPALDASAISSASPAAPPSAQAHARDLVALRGFLGRAARARARTSESLAAPCSPSSPQDDRARHPPSPSCLTRRSRTSRRSSLREGGLIREGWNAELRDLKQSAREGKRVDRLARAARARADGHRHPSRPLQSRLRLRDRGEQCSGGQGARRLYPPADPGRAPSATSRRS